MKKLLLIGLLLAFAACGKDKKPEAAKPDPAAAATQPAGSAAAPAAAEPGSAAKGGW
jgi:hypothetical protein